MEPNHYDFIKELGYMPVGLGEKNFNPNWMSDKSKDNISKKNKYYGEYTYHYWIWKNYLDQLEDQWIGFCQYRKFWSSKNYIVKDVNFNNLDSYLIKEIPESALAGFKQRFTCIPLCKPMPCRSILSLIVFCGFITLKQGIQKAKNSGKTTYITKKYNLILPSISKNFGKKANFFNISVTNFRYCFCFPSIFNNF